MVALLAVVVTVDEVNVSILVDRHSHPVDGERFGSTTAGEFGAGRFGSLTLDTFVLDSWSPVAGELGATDSELLGAAVEAAAGKAVHLEASIVGDRPLRYRRATEVQPRLLVVGTLVARTGAGRQLVAVTPACLLDVLAPDTLDLHSDTTHGCSLLDSQEAQEKGCIGAHLDDELRDCCIESNDLSSGSD